ncbi:MAG: polyprenyl synthetase family protein [Herminiimonas sp.]|nr:polyprenyl synthetase family protein [Herminiimonas sp.]
MSAQLAAAANAPAWSVLDCLDFVEQRCRILIKPPLGSGTGMLGEAARAAGYHLQVGGRRIRARLALDASLQLGLSSSTAVAIASTCELLHNASLVHDDLQDRDSTRRGVDAVWTSFGADIAICAGDLLLSSAYASLAGVDDPTYLSQMLSLIHARTAAAIQGQSCDLAHRTIQVEDVDTYLRIVACKSGALLSLPLELALLCAGQVQWADKARAAAEAFAIGYQIADDLHDIGSDKTAKVLNIFLLLEQRHVANDDHPDADRSANIRRQCVLLASQHLALAASAAVSLPGRCGNLLAQLATELNRHL